ncbi:hypothetical protein SELMODRAFT_403715 [Selaginella moellendorffii]|uniref:Uncharacterized protein n=1 Tax=Selaginella moellendorffii TaxID=88036 RepID=D8QSA5_SELML|nr:ricin B-like lectin R40C1 [Selaginella moellendorffii]EFJ36905.1 hypothetical protein SELMODRAFT_403715 [Selaginella moellendorffii]|eukprot:XP_002961645.1 ricin B-like lectin R40C1 [Selaginella moellendorffii]
MEPLTAVPKLYAIESTAYPGYCITQQGTQIVLKFKDALNPFQLWYRDESWQFLSEDNSDLSALVFINHGSKKALRSQSSSTSRSIAKLTVGDYDPAVENNSLLWSISGSSDDQVFVTETGNSSVFLSHTSSSRSSFKDGVPVVTSAQGENSRWKIVAYVPSQVYRILCHWFGNYLTWKQQNVDVTFKNAIKHNDETNVVAVSPNNISLDGMAWFKVPAGGRDNTTYFTSFILINKTGLALKGSTKPGDKVLLTQYDPLDYGFVWSENRFQASNTDYVAINLDGTNLQWSLQNDDQYQNSAWYHPLVLRPASANQGYVEQQTWKFNPVVNNV